MSKVFEALERHQKSRIDQNGRDPLVTETGVSEESAIIPSNAAAGNGNRPGNESVNEINPAIAGFAEVAVIEMPSVIGAPVAPRPNDGAVFPSLNLPRQESATPQGRVSSEAVEDRTKVLTRPNGKTSFKPGSVAPQAANGQSRKPHPNQAQLNRPSGEKAPVRGPREIPVERIALPQLHSRLILLTDPDASECEQYRTLRTQLFHAAEKKLTQVVVISSALPGEGKTSTTLNLAFAIAQSKERRVLVIDGDLRRPSIASYLGIRPETGLGDVLAGASGPLDSIFCVDEYDLYVLAVNRDSSNPTELLSSERLEKMIEEMRDYFDFILVDSPPVMPFADTRLLANHSDSIILVVRAGMAPYETVEKSIEALPPGRILGVVLNSAENLSSADYYDYYYDYAERAERRRSFWHKIKNRIGASWVGKRMDLK